MANIPVEKKSGGPSWLWWLLGLIAIAGLIWLVAEAVDGDDAIEQIPVASDTTMTAPSSGAAPDTAAGDVPARVNEFLAFQRSDTVAVDAEMGLHHEYTSRGIELLAGALSAVVNRYDVGDIEIEARLDTLMQRAEAIRQDPTSLQHANKVRDAFRSAADLIESIQQKRHPDAASSVADVRQAAESITAETPLLDQKEDVRTFFDRAGNALQRITPASSTS